jgi:hypothetical protein
MFRTVPLSFIRMEHSSILILLASCQQTCMTYTTAVCTVKKTPDDGQRDCTKHAEFYSKNKYEELVHLVGLIIRKPRLFFAQMNHIRVRNSTVHVLLLGRSSSHPPGWLWFPRGLLCHGCLSPGVKKLSVMLTIHPALYRG